MKVNLRNKLGLDIKKEQVYIIPVFIPHRGCKNECIFCNQKKISGEQREVTTQDVKNIIDEFLDYYKSKPYKKIQVAFFGGSFTGLDMEEQQEFLSVTNEYINNKKIGSVRISTRPDYITDDILYFLKQRHVKVIELGVQSMNNEVLLKAKRGHTKQDVEVASSLIKKYGFKLGHQIMVGLPNSTKEIELETIRQCLKLKPDMLRIYPVYTLEQSELYEMYKNKTYTPLTLEEAVERTKQVYMECVKARLNVIRIGLQTTEEINSNNTKIVGPVCDNYKERVLSAIAKQELEKILDIRLKQKGIDIVEIKVKKDEINYIIGTNKENKKYFEEKYKIKLRIKI